MTTPQTLRNALHALEKYAEKCTPTGGVDPATDSVWICLTRRIEKIHDQWALAQGLPPSAVEYRSPSSLEAWARQLRMNSISARRLAAILCHLDVIRCLETWPQTIDRPLDAFWYPMTGPTFVRVPEAAWAVAIGAEDQGDEWLEDLLTRCLVITGAQTPQEIQERIVPNQYLLDELPGLLTAHWIHRNWLWQRYEPPARQRALQLSDEVSDSDPFDYLIHDE